MKSSSVIRVRYADTDKMGFVYHSNFLVYFEVGRTDYFRQFGFTYKDMETDRVFMPVTECNCRYLTPAHYDDELEVTTELQMVSRLKLKFLYDIVRKQDSTLIAQGYTIHVPINGQGSPCRIPRPYLNALTGEKSAE